MPSIDIHLDWLRWSVGRSPGAISYDEVRAALPDYPLYDLTTESATVGQGYNAGLKLRSGMVFWHSDRDVQGISVQLSGLDLQDARDYPIAELDLLMALQSKKAKITTLHSCINVHNAGASPTDILEAQKNGTLETRARNIGVYSSTQKVRKQWLAGDTIYVGSPKSGIQIRVYNKAAEQRIAGDWTRIEIVFRGDYAHNAFVAMCKYGVPSVTRMAIQKQMTFSAEWWVYAMRGGISPPMQVRRKVRGTITWLKNVVIPALGREIDAEREMNSDTLYEHFAAFIASKTPRP